MSHQYKTENLLYSMSFSIDYDSNVFNHNFKLFIFFKCIIKSKLVNNKVIKLKKLIPFIYIYKNLYQ